MISTDFPGGSADVETLDSENRVVRMRPTHHKDRGWACCWYFRISGIEPGETITIEIETEVA